MFGIGKSGPEKGVITKGVSSLEESLGSLKSQHSLESPENGRILLYFPQPGGSLKSLESLNSLGACTMTTKLLDNKIVTFKILLS